MLRIPAAIAILALLVPAGRSPRVKASTPTKPARLPDVLPFQATEKLLPNGLKVIVVPTGFPNIVSLQIPVQTGLAQRGRARQVGLRPLLRAHDVPRHEGLPAREVPGDPDAGRRPPERLHDRRLHQLPHDLLQGGPRADAQGRGRPLPEPLLRRGGVQDRGARGARRVQQEQRQPDHQARRGPAREGLHDAHLQAHDDGLPQGHRGHAQPVSSTRRSSSQRWYRPEYTTVIVAGDVQADEVIRLVEKYWGGWKRGTYQRRRSRRSRRQKAPVYAHVPWTSPTLPWVTVAFHGPAFSDTEKDFAAMDMLFDLSFGETSDLYKRLVETGAEGRPDLRRQRRRRGPRARRPSTRASRRSRTRSTSATRSSRRSRRPSPTPVDARRLAEAKSNARYSFARRLDNTETIAATLARFVRYERSYETLNRLYRVYASLTPADLQAVAKKYFTDANLVRRDALEGRRCRTAMAALCRRSPTFAPEAAAGRRGPGLPRPEDRAAAVERQAPLHRRARPTTRKGKEGLSALAAAMVAEAGSKDLRIDEINKALYPDGRHRSTTRWTRR